MADNILEKILRPSARGRMWQLFFLIVVIMVVTGVYDAGGYYNRGADWLAGKTNEVVRLPKLTPPSFRLGLDLLGGTHLVYEADMQAVSDLDRSNALEGVRDVIERRVNAFGVAEPVVQTSGGGSDYRVIVELAGVKDVNEAIKMIGETPLLEFKEQGDGEVALTEEQQANLATANEQAKRRAEEILGKLLSNGDFAALAKEYSDDQTSKEKGGDLGWITSRENAFLVETAAKLKVGEMTRDLLTGPDGYEFVKLEGKRQKANPFNEAEVEKEVKARHLLLCYDEVEGCTSGLTKDEAYAKIKALKEKATGANFSDLVKDNTTEPGGAARGGDLGWFRRGDMVAPFEDAVFPQALNTVSFVVETQFGYHLIYKEAERPIEEFQVRHILVRTAKAADIAGENQSWTNTELTGKYLTRATVQMSQVDNSPEVSLEFNSEGADLFGKITERNVGKPVAIFLDGEPISTPTVNERITGGRAVISGRFSVTEAQLLAQRLNAGALPVPIKLMSQQTVGASLGQASLERSLKAALYGFLFVALFMIVFYRLPGLLSVFSLVFYALVTLALFKLISVTLTLAGLAGFVLSIGMAVDANVLIFARLKEELERGNPLNRAIHQAFDRAWPSIRDGNLSTLITCAVLIFFSTSVVKGFAVTLTIGILVSMVSAIYVTKNFFLLILGDWLATRPWLIGVRSKNRT